MMMGEEKEEEEDKNIFCSKSGALEAQLQRRLADAVRTTRFRRHCAATLMRARRMRARFPCSLHCRVDPAATGSG